MLSGTLPLVGHTTDLALGNITKIEYLKIGSCGWASPWVQLSPAVGILGVAAPPLPEVPKPLLARAAAGGDKPKNKMDAFFLFLSRLSATDFNWLLVCANHKRRSLLCLLHVLLRVDGSSLAPRSWGMCYCACPWQRQVCRAFFCRAAALSPVQTLYLISQRKHNFLLFSSYIVIYCVRLWKGEMQRISYIHKEKWLKKAVSHFLIWL